MLSIHLRLGLPSGLFPDASRCFNFLIHTHRPLTGISLFYFVLQCVYCFEEWCLLGCYAVWLL
jgi:hypothetical protein